MHACIYILHGRLGLGHHRSVEAPTHVRLDGRVGRFRRLGQDIMLAFAMVHACDDTPRVPCTPRERPVLVRRVRGVLVKALAGRVLRLQYGRMHSKRVIVVCAMFLLGVCCACSPPIAAPV